jgi:hypothetical protein
LCSPGSWPGSAGADQLPRSAARWNRSNARTASAADIPGPASATSISTPPEIAPSRTATGVAGGVWARTLPSRFAITCRTRGSSTTATSRGGASARTGRSGCTATASATASLTTAARSVSVRSSEEVRSSRASSSSSATSVLIRCAAFGQVRDVLPEHRGGLADLVVDQVREQVRTDGAHHDQQDCGDRD